MNVMKAHHLTSTKIDSKQMGFVNDNSWGARTHEACRLIKKSSTYSYAIRHALLSVVVSK
jgi:hypothetical protein